MNKDKVLGLVVGGAIGDAYGAPYEFMDPHDLPTLQDSYDSGGVHGVSAGEWTDDTALMLAAADAYISAKRFDPAQTAINFRDWKRTGKFGTRNYVFDIGGTCGSAIDRMTHEQPYAGKCTKFASGNGSIMRVAPAIAANHSNQQLAIAEGIALSLMTHGNEDTIEYITAFIAGFFDDGYHYPYLEKIINVPMFGNGSIMQSYSIALYASRKSNFNFMKSLKTAVSIGHDTDTNACVTGMMVGGSIGLSRIPQHLINDLVDGEKIIKIASDLYDVGCSR